MNVLIFVAVKHYFSAKLVATSKAYKKQVESVIWKTTKSGKRSIRGNNRSWKSWPIRMFVCTVRNLFKNMWNSYLRARRKDIIKLDETLVAVQDCSSPTFTAVYWAGKLSQPTKLIALTIPAVWLHRLSLRFACITVFFYLCIISRELKNSEWQGKKKGSRKMYTVWINALKFNWKNSKTFSQKLIHFKTANQTIHLYWVIFIHLSGLTILCTKYLWTIWWNVHKIQCHILLGNYSVVP